MRKLVALAALLALVLVGCGSSSNDEADPLAGGSSSGADAHAGHSDDAGGAAACEPSGSALTVTAKNTTYDKACLAAPAGKAFTIKFQNNDDLPHNVTILTSHTATDSFFSGDLLTGPNKSITYNVSALPAGTYHFHCMVHPDQMNGTFVVK